MSGLGNKEIMAKNIRRLMDMKGKDRNEICKDLGFKYTTFTDWVNGNTYPRIDKIEMMANYFGVSKSELVEENTRNNDEHFSLSDTEKKIVTKYRESDDITKAMVLRALSIEEVSEDKNQKKRMA